MYYDFKNIKSYVENVLGINTENVKSNFEPIKERLTHQQISEKVKFASDGIFYIDDNGKDHKGFLYIEIFDPIEWRRRGYKNTVPRFHILNCETIQSQRQKYNFNGHYVFSNKPVNDVKDAEGNENDLQLCGYCFKSQTTVKLRTINTTTYCKEYIEPLNSQNNFKKSDLPKDIPIDMYGYTEDWDEKSKYYRLKKNFTCEMCGIKLNESYIDGYYLETHHKSGIKTDNREENLICLCTLCHSNVDENHKMNYSSYKNKKKLMDFIEIYIDRLKNVNNPYISNNSFEMDMPF